MTSTTLTGSPEFDRRRAQIAAAARVREVSWRFDGLLFRVEAWPAIRSTHLVFDRAADGLRWPAMFVNGARNLRAEDHRAGSADEVVAGTSGRVLLRRRDATQEHEVAALNVSLQAVTHPGGVDGAELRLAGDVLLNDDLLRALSDGVWDVKVELNALGRRVEKSPELPLTLLPASRGQARGRDQRLVTPYSTQGGTAAVFVGEPAPAGLQVLDIDMLTAFAATIAGTLRFGARIPGLASTKLTLRLRAGDTAVEAGGSADSDGHVEVEVARDRLPAGAWTIEVATPSLDWTPVHATLVLADYGPPALLSGSPTPTSLVIPPSIEERRQAADREAAEQKKAADREAAEQEKAAAEQAAATRAANRTRVRSTVKRTGGRVVRALPGPLAARVRSPVRRLARRLHLV